MIDSRMKIKCKCTEVMSSANTAHLGDLYSPILTSFTHLSIKRLRSLDEPYLFMS